LHVSKSKLPSLAKKILKAGSKQVTVFQNSERLYWRLVAQKKEEKVDVIQLRRDAYCVFNSPPWLKWQAYLDFLEKKAGFEEQPDFADTIHKYCQSISGVLSLKEKFIDFHAFKTGDTHFASSLARFDISFREQKYLQKLIQSGASFYVPGLHLFYFQSTAVNKVVSLVGQYIHAKLNSNKKIMCSFPADFDEMIWRESIGFFFSKILNNRRKIRLPEPTPSHKVVTVLAMEYRLKQQLALSLGQDLEVLKAHSNRKTKHYLEASTLIGAILGQKIYDGFMSGRIEKDRLKSWLQHGFEKRNHFRRFYLNVLMYLSELKLKSTNPRDRL
jgi:hypothetical protein